MLISTFTCSIIRVGICSYRGDLVPIPMTTVTMTLTNIMIGLAATIISVAGKIFIVVKVWVNTRLPI